MPLSDAVDFKSVVKESFRIQCNAHVSKMHRWDVLRVLELFVPCVELLFRVIVASKALRDKKKAARSAYAPLRIIAYVLSLSEVSMVSSQARNLHMKVEERCGTTPIKMLRTRQHSYIPSL